MYFKAGTALAPAARGIEADTTIALHRWQSAAWYGHNGFIERDRLHDDRREVVTHDSIVSVFLRALFAARFPRPSARARGRTEARGSNARKMRDAARCGERGHAQPGLVSGRQPQLFSDRSGMRTGAAVQAVPRCPTVNSLQIKVLASRCGTYPRFMTAGAACSLNGKKSAIILPVYMVDCGRAVAAGGSIRKTACPQRLGPGAAERNGRIRKT